jgi:hypothetical protein
MFSQSEFPSRSQGPALYPEEARRALALRVGHNAGPRPHRPGLRTGGGVMAAARRTVDESRSAGDHAGSRNESAMRASRLRPPRRARCGASDAGPLPARLASS